MSEDPIINFAVLNKKTDLHTGNNLFPVFLKLENLRLLIVGGGYVGMEKLRTVLQNSPDLMKPMIWMMPIS
jgi:hypothetical protein